MAPRFTPALKAVIRPPCSSTTARAMARPRPRPPKRCPPLSVAQRDAIGFALGGEFCGQGRGAPSRLEGAAPFRQRGFEVDEKVAAADEVHAQERGIADQIVVGEDADVAGPFADAVPPGSPRRPAEGIGGCGETPQPAPETGALPGPELETVAADHELIAKFMLARQRWKHADRRRTRGTGLPARWRGSSMACPASAGGPSAVWSSHTLGRPVPRAVAGSRPRASAACAP